MMLRWTPRLSFSEERLRVWGVRAARLGARIGSTRSIMASARLAHNRKWPRRNGGVWCVLRKRGHIEDVQSVVAHAPHFTLLSVNRTWQKAVTAGCVPFLPDDRYRSCRLENRQSYERAVTVWQGVLQNMIQNHGVSLITTGNVGYGMEQPMMEAARREDLPFLVMHKECVKTPADVTGWLETYRSGYLPSPAARILTYNETEARCLIEGGVARREQIHVCGMPRMDAIHARRVARAGTAPPRGVLFLSFGADAGTIIGANANTWSELRQTSHEFIVKFAREHPSIPVVIKGKSSEYEQARLERLLQDIGPKPKNLMTSYAGDIRTLFENVCVVIGFNSTALLESMASGLPTLVLSWAEAADPKNAERQLYFTSGVTRAPDENTLTSLIRRYIDFEEPIPGRLHPDVEQELSRWVANPDGRASIRAWEAIQGCLHEYRACGEFVG